MREAKVIPTTADRFEPIIGQKRFAAFMQLADLSRERFLGRTIWNINSTETGGGVAEMLRTLVATALGLGVDCRWLVIPGDFEFFQITKRIHNAVHGMVGDGSPLGPAQRAHYEAVLAPNRRLLERVVRPGDVVILHDPQTAGMVDMTRACGAKVVWRCHIGRDTGNDQTAAAWEFIEPYVRNADALVFSRAQYVPESMRDRTVMIIPPALDPFAVKNIPLERAEVRAILAASGLLRSDGSSAEPVFPRSHGTGRVVRRAKIVREGEPLSADMPLAVQVSRWDRLKDMRGVLESFATHVAGLLPDDDVHLFLVGPDVSRVSDDPEGVQVLAECTEAWRGLLREQRQRISLVSLPMQDTDENAAIVNAVQRHASIVAQKSLVEGFGLTVAEAMWKARPVVGGAVGGILDQITDGEDGLLIEPLDYEGFGAALRKLFADLGEAHRMGLAAQEKVRRQFLPDRQLTQWIQLLDQMSP